MQHGLFAFVSKSFNPLFHVVFGHDDILYEEVRLVVSNAMAEFIGPCDGW